MRSEHMIVRPRRIGNTMPWRLESSPLNSAAAGVAAADRCHHPAAGEVGDHCRHPVAGEVVHQADSSVHRPALPDRIRHFVKIRFASLAVFQPPPPAHAKSTCPAENTRYTSPVAAVSFRLPAEELLQPLNGAMRPRVTKSRLFLRKSPQVMWVNRLPAHRFPAPSPGRSCDPVPPG